MATNALATQSKTVQAQAQALARSAAAKRGKEVRSKHKVTSTGLGGAAALALGVAERFAPGKQLGPIPNGLTVGVPLVVLGALIASKLGDYCLAVGNGPFFAGLHEAGKTLGVSDEADTSGDYDRVMD